MELKLQSREAHREIERHPYLRALFGRQLRVRAWSAHLVDLAHVYEALEQSLERNPDTRSLLLPALAGRAERLITDRGRLPAADLHPSAAARAYAHRVLAVSADTPLLVGHAYTRHLGDLAGGQMVARALGACFGAASALSFHDFSAHGSCAELSEAWRARADALGLDAQAVDRAASEACLAFGLNRDLLDAAWSA